MEEVLRFLEGGEGIPSYLVLAASAALEYVFPPFPGDTVTLFGAFLITARGWNVGAVLFAVTVGSLVGATLDYYIGVGLARDGCKESENWLICYWRRAQGRLEGLVRRLRKRGASYIVINRFLPGVRALFFVAAGMAGLRLRAVLFYATLSSLLWNLLIIAVGAWLGTSWERLQALFETYTSILWSVLAVLVSILIVRWLHRKRTEDRRNQEQLETIEKESKSHESQP